MATGMTPKLEQTLDAFAAAHGYPSVQAVINRAGTVKPDKGKVIIFKSQPRLYWIEKE